MCAVCDAMTDRKKGEVHPDLAALLAGYAARGIGSPDPAAVGPVEARRKNEEYFREIAEPRVTVQSVDTVMAASAEGDVPVKVAVPSGAKAKTPALLYCHGGGYTFGDLETHDHVIRAIAAMTGMVVFGVHYRRTPEHAYPAALNDSLAALEAMRGQDWVKRFGHNPKKICVIGDSAGAHLGLTLMLALREKNRPQVQGAALIYGMYSRRYDTWSHHAYGDGRLGLGTERMRWFWDQLAKGHSGKADPLLEPLEADLKGLPPLALFAAECDCLLDDTLDFRESCKRQDHPHTFDLFRGATHGFMHLSSVYAGTRQALAIVANRLKAMV